MSSVLSIQAAAQSFPVGIYHLYGIQGVFAT